MTAPMTVGCAGSVWVPVRPGSRRKTLEPCPDAGTVAVQWGEQPATLCQPCADRLVDGDLIQACRLPDGVRVVALTGDDQAEVQRRCRQIARPYDSVCYFGQAQISVVIQHWGRLTAAFQVLREVGFEACQPNDTPTILVVGRRIRQGRR